MINKLCPILVSKDNLLCPFRPLSTQPKRIDVKIASIALFIFLSLITFGVAGIFYLITAAVKLNQSLKKIERRYPPLGGSDTLDEEEEVFNRLNLFKNSEILEVHKVEKRVSLEEEVDVDYTKHQVAIIQQQSLKGEIAAVCAMLILDKGKTCSVDDLLISGGDGRDIVRNIKNAGLTSIGSVVSDLKGLKLAIEKDGPAIVSLEAEVAGRSLVVVDAVEDKSIRLRDPYHGWEITVTRQAFMERWELRTIIQVV